MTAIEQAAMQSSIAAMPAIPSRQESGALAMSAGTDCDDWLNELYGLLVRFSNLGIGADIGAMSLVELWGVYQFLKRISEL
ncbi:MAG TPA: hypothetical protein VIE65_03485 [Methylobacter sp.]|jgi:hypothetical protein